MTTRARLLLVAGVMALALGCDRATKQIAVDNLRGAPPISIANDLLRLEYAENTGAFLSLGANLPAEIRTIVFVYGVGILLFGLLGVALFNRSLRPLIVTGFALIVGGGLGNWVDRVAKGSVVDFAIVGIGPVRSGVFNLADLFVEVGVILVLWVSLRAEPEPDGAVEPSERQREGVS